MPEEDKLILVGVISAAHGIKGDVIVKSYTKPIDNIFQLEIVNNNHTPIYLKMNKINSKGGIICKLAGCNDRNQAEALKGLKLFSNRKILPNTTTEEFYFEDLKNLKVIDKSGKQLGTVLGVFNFGAGDIIEIQFTKNKKEEMFPFTKEFFPEVTKEYIVLTPTQQKN